MREKKPLTFFGKKLKPKGSREFVGKNVSVGHQNYQSAGVGWVATYDSHRVLEYTDPRATPEGALRVLENRLRRMRTALNKLIPGSNRS